jgi:hypothetical protein
MLGEPGAGKSTVLKQYGDAIRQQLHPDRSVSLIKNLNLFNSDSLLVASVFQSELCQRWLESDKTLYLVLDSLDECLLRVDTAAALLGDWLKGAPVERMHLCISCRTAEWPKSLERVLTELWGEQNVDFLELAPLRKVDVEEAANRTGLDSALFLRLIDERGAAPLAIKPITLRFLLNVFKTKQTLPATQHDLYQLGCLKLAEEMNENRRASQRLRGSLDPRQRFLVAGRIAALLTLSNRSSIWTEPDVGDRDEASLPIADIVGGTESVEGASFPVVEATIREVLDTGLFSSRGAGRMGFAHQTYREFLAASYLTLRGLPDDRLADLVFHSADGGLKVVPQLHEMAAWLARMTQPLFQRILATDPQVLLRSDVGTASDLEKSALVASLLEHFDQGHLIDDDWALRHHYAKLNHRMIGDQLRPYVRGRQKNNIVRRVAIDIINECNVASLQQQLADVALDSADDPTIRAHAAAALVRVGNEEGRRRLRPCAFGEAGVDPHDELKGHALDGLWPGLLTTTEVLSALSTEQDPSYTGSYRMFLWKKLPEQIPVCDIPLALDWAAGQQGVGSDLGAFGQFTDALVARALTCLDAPNVVAAFANLVLQKLRHHQDLLPPHRAVGTSPSICTTARYELIQTIVPLMQQRGVFPFQLLHCSPQLVHSTDVPWMVDKLRSCSDEELKRAWARLIHTALARDSAHIDLVLTACDSDAVLAEVFRPLTAPVELDSDIASQLREQFRQMQSLSERHSQPLDEPSSVERIEVGLASVEAGDMHAWWRLNLEMMRAPSNPFGVIALETDIRSLPGFIRKLRARRKSFVVLILALSH